MGHAQVGGVAAGPGAEGPAAVPPPQTMEEVAPAGSFALYFFSVRPLTRVASEWRRLMASTARSSQAMGE